MPIREYQVNDPAQGCAACCRPFERLERLQAPPLDKCPVCGAPISRLISAPVVGGSKSSLDRRASQAGFHKLKRLGRGEYEKQY